MTKTFEERGNFIEKFLEMAMLGWTKLYVRSPDNELTVWEVGQST